MTRRLTMKSMRVAQDIVPLADFKARVSEVIREMRAHRRPVVVTQSGRPAAVMMAAEDFDQLMERARVIAAVEEGLADADAGRTITDAELGRRLDRKFGKLRR
jgi:prevent-host-death family protein